MTRLTVLGGGGAHPTVDRGCSGYLIECNGFGLLVDPGFGTVVRLPVPAEAVDAVVVTHGHADHCADLNPLLRIRHLSASPPPALPTYALPGALDAVLALDGPMLTDDHELRTFVPGDELQLGPFTVATRALDHFVLNVGLRIHTGRTSIAYPGDGGGDPAVVALAEGADLLLADATFVDEVPADSRGRLGSASLAGAQAAAAGVRQLILAHRWPGTDDDEAVQAATRHFAGTVQVARPGLVVDLS